jgi:hypothetical protein
VTAAFHSVWWQTCVNSDGDESVVTTEETMVEKWYDLQGKMADELQ